jgi:hypothetical protein
MRYDVLHESEGCLCHFSTVYAPDDAAARRLVAEKWLLEEPDVRLTVVRVDGERLTIVSRRRE